MQHKLFNCLFIGPHLPRVYHSVTLWLFADFSCLLGIAIPLQNRLLLHVKLEAYSKHSRASKVELFTKIINWFQPLTIFIKSSMLDVRVGSEWVLLKHCFILHAETQLLNFNT